MAKKIALDKLGVYLERDIRTENALEFKSYAFEVFSQVIQKTPVDTGRARGNWNITTDTPDYSTSESTSNEIASLDVSNFPTIFIANGLDYIVDLEGGKSEQAPAGISIPALAAVRNKRR